MCNEIVGDSREKDLGLRKMSDSPTDLAAEWTFVSSSSELNEEMQSTGAAGDKNNTNESCVDVKKDTDSDIGKAEEVVDPSGVEELEDDLPSVSSESESLPSSDVDVLEESVGPDHDILEVSTSSHASTTFKISSPLEGLLGFQHSGSATVSSEFSKVEMDAITNHDIAGQSGEPVKSELPSVMSPKSLAEAAASAQLAQSSNASDNSLHSKPQEHVQDLTNVPTFSKTSVGLSRVESKLLRKQKSSEIPHNLSHSKPEKSLQEQVSAQKPQEKAQRRSQKVKSRREKSALIDFMITHNFVPAAFSEFTYLAAYFLMWCFTVLIVYWMLPGASDLGFLSINVAKELKNAQDETLKCLGLQHLTAVENNHYTMLLTNVCMNDSAAWKQIFEDLLKEKALKNLLQNVYHESSIEKKTEIIEKFSSFTRTNMEGIRLDLLILQMEHLELLSPVEESGIGKEKHKSFVVPDLLSEKLEEQQGMLNQLHEFIQRLKLANFALKSVDAELKVTDSDETHVDLTALKPGIYRLELENAFLSYRLQRMLDEFENGEFLDPEYWLGSFNLNNALNHIASSTAGELMEKVNYLLSSNDEMRRLHSHFSVMKQHLKSGKNKGSNAEFSENQIDKLKSLVTELLGVHQSISGELNEVKKWNEMLAAITSELRNAHEDVATGYWNWSSFKRAFKGMFAGTQQNLAEILKDIKHLDISEVFSYAEEGKPFVKEMFESVSSFWEKTGIKSKEFLTKALRGLGTDLSSVFNPPSSWDGTRQESQEFPKESEAEKDSAGEPNDSSGNRESSTSDYKDEWDKFKSDWLFQRAANREILRHTARTKPMNWYLWRGHSMWHSPMTKEQEELLQRMEASSYPQHAKSYGRESKDQK